MRPEADLMLHVGPIHTIGHSTLPLDAFVAALHDAWVWAGWENRDWSGWSALEEETRANE
jgi:S-adenosylmethionine:diacylglycerol 3-amino-3-carboxypropyl transferase